MICPIQTPRFPLAYGFLLLIAIPKKQNKANYLEKENGQWKMISNFWMEYKKAK